jgi:penicillin-binding protein 1C
VPVELDGTRGRVVFEAAHRERSGTIWWHLDGEYVGETHALHELALAPAAGDHELVLVDADGARLARRFKVLSATSGG